MRIGAHVRAGAGLVGALERGREIGAEVVQVFTQSPRAWKPTLYRTEVLAAYRSAQEADPVVRATYCHATYLVNLASPDPVLAARSLDCLVANLSAARGMGARGLVLHLGSHRGAGMADRLAPVVDGLLRAIEQARDPLGVGADDPAACPILVENTAGAGDTVGCTCEELALVLDKAAAGPALGVCLDTAHLWAAGVDFSTPARADAVLGSFDRAIGLERLAFVHFNDSKVPRGARRDRHENPGAGTIGASALAALAGHPALDRLDAALEVPGSGDGPREEDLRAARDMVARGRARHRRSPAARAGAVPLAECTPGPDGPSGRRPRTATAKEER